MSRRPARHFQNQVVSNIVIFRGRNSRGQTGQFANGVDLPSQMLPDEHDVAAVNEWIGAHLQPAHLLLGLAPEMNSRADSGRAGLAEDRFTGRQEVGMLVLFG